MNIKKTRNVIALSAMVLGLTASSAFAGSWTPAERVTDLWLDADDASTITGATVSTWQDKSGNSRDATQGTAANQPTDTAAGMNGKHVLTFDGSTDYMNFGTGLDFLAGVSHSAFIVTKMTGSADIYGAANGSAGSSSLHVGFSSLTNYRMNYWGNDFGTATTANFHSGEGNVVNYVWIPGGTKQILANGSVEGTSGATHAGTITAMSGGGRISNVVGHGYYGGYIAEIIMITGAVTLEERETIEGYLAHKWGLEAYLPAAHPYKDSAPGGTDEAIAFADLGTSNITATAASPYATASTNMTACTLVWDTEDMGDTNVLVWTGSSSLSTTNAGEVTGNATGLTEDTLYSFRFFGEDATPTNGWSDVETFATSLTAAQTPVFTNAVATFNSVTLEWDDNAATETGYVLQRSTNGVDYAVVALLDANTTMHTDGGLMSLITYHYQLAATNDLNESSTAFSACATNATTLYMPPVTTYSGQTGTWNADTWNNAANWDAGVPSASQEAIIAEGEYASVYESADTPAYTGSLTLGAGSGLEIGQTAVPEVLNALGGSNIYFNTGSELRLRYNKDNQSTHSQNFVMLGDAKFTLGTSTSAHNDSRTLTGEISGSGQLTIHVSNNNTLYLKGNSPSWSGGLTAPASENESKSSRIEADVTNALGTGDINVEDGMGLQIDAADAMGDGATLSLSGGDGSLNQKLVMNADDTVGALFVDGFPFPAGTHGRVGTPASVDYEWAWLAGDSVLTVSTAPTDDSSAPVLVDITSDSGNGTHYYKLEPATYTLTFNEPVNSAVTTADFENAGTATVTIDSVTQTELNEFQVGLTASSTGTLILRIKSSASFDDLFGNTLSGPITDDTTNMVIELPPASLLYEPFDYTVGQGLSGLNGGTGWGGAWAVPKNNPTVREPNNEWGELLVLGARINPPGWSIIYRPIGTTLADAGLMSNGATLWFAFVADILNQNLTNLDYNFALCNDNFSANYSYKTDLLNGGQGIGVGCYRKDFMAAYWKNNDADEFGDRTTSSEKLALNSTDNSRVLFVGKIEWGADGSAAEKITLYTPGHDLVLPTPLVDSWETDALDQSSFDRISIQWKDSQPSIDEIRFGASFDEVIGIALPPGGTLIMIK